MILLLALLIAAGALVWERGAAPQSRLAAAEPRGTFRAAGVALALILLAVAGRMVFEPGASAVSWLIGFGALLLLVGLVRWWGAPAAAARTIGWVLTFAALSLTAAAEAWFLVPLAPLVIGMRRHEPGAGVAPAGHGASPAGVAGIRRG